MWKQTIAVICSYFTMSTGFWRINDQKINMNVNNYFTINVSYWNESLHNYYKQDKMEMWVTSDLEDDELSLLYFALLGYNVIGEVALHPCLHGLLSILEKFWFLQITWTREALSELKEYCWSCVSRIVSLCHRATGQQILKTHQSATMFRLCDTFVINTFPQTPCCCLKYSPIMSSRVAPALKFMSYRSDTMTLYPCSVSSWSATSRTAALNEAELWWAYTIRAVFWAITQTQ